MKIEAKAAIPNLQSSISIGGGKGNAVRLKLDVYMNPDDIAKLYQMQEEEIDLRMSTANVIGADGMFTPEGF